MKDALRRAALLALCAAAPDGPPGPARQVELRNDTAAPLECQALAAHWHSLPPLALPPAGRATLTLHAAADGGGLRVAPGGPALERLFCGPPGRAWANRAEIEWPPGAPPRAVSCRAAGAILACKAAPEGN